MSRNGAYLTTKKCFSKKKLRKGQSVLSLRIVVVVVLACYLDVLYNYMIIFIVEEHHLKRQYVVVITYIKPW